MASVRHLEFEKFRFFLSNNGMEVCIGIPNLLEIGQFRLRYGYKAIFKMAALRHLEFGKIAVLVT